MAILTPPSKRQEGLECELLQDVQAADPYPTWRCGECHFKGGLAFSAGHDLICALQYELKTASCTVAFIPGSDIMRINQRWTTTRQRNAALQRLTSAQGAIDMIQILYEGLAPPN
jgi:hypothetical protein